MVLTLLLLCLCLLLPRWTGESVPLSSKSEPLSLPADFDLLDLFGFFLMPGVLSLGFTGAGAGAGGTYPGAKVGNLVQHFSALCPFLLQ